MTDPRVHFTSNISTQDTLSAKQTSNGGLSHRYLAQSLAKRPHRALPAATANAPIWPCACSKDPTRRSLPASRTPLCAPQRVRFDRAQDHRRALRTRRARGPNRPIVRSHARSSTHTQRALRDAAGAALDAADRAWPAWKMVSDGAERVVHCQVPVGKGGDSHIRSGAGHSMADPPERRRRNRAPNDLIARDDRSTSRATWCRMELEA